MKTEKYFKALSDETRLRLFYLLIHYELNVNELVLILQMGQSRISRHLKVLSESGLLRYRRDAGFTYYQVRTDPQLKTLIKFVQDNLAEDPAREDLYRAQTIIRERKNETRRFFNQIAEHWERLKKDILGEVDISRTVSENVPPANRAVDIGCGTGELMLYLLPKTDKVIGVDHSAQMLNMARLKLEAHQFSDRVDLRLGEMEHLPLRDKEVEVATMSMVLHHSPLPQAGIEEANRVLLPGGILVIADFAKHSREDIRRKYGQTWLGFEQEDIQTWLEAAGFELQKNESHPVRHGLFVNIFRSVKSSEAQA